MHENATNASENIVCEMVAIFFQGRCIKRIHPELQTL